MRKKRQISIHSLDTVRYPLLSTFSGVRSVCDTSLLIVSINHETCTVEHRCKHWPIRVSLDRMSKQARTRLDEKKTSKTVTNTFIAQWTTNRHEHTCCLFKQSAFSAIIYLLCIYLRAATENTVRCKCQTCIPLAIVKARTSTRRQVTWLMGDTFALALEAKNCVIENPASPS